MSSTLSFGNLQFNFTLGKAAAARPPEAPFRLAVLGDFTGRASRGLSEPISQRRVWTVDCDNFPELMKRLQPRLKLPGSGELIFSSLDDFRPEHLLKQVPQLQELSARKLQLNVPPAAAAEAAPAGPSGTPMPLSNEPGPSSPPAESGADFARLLGGTPSAPAPSPATKPSPVQRLLRQAVGASARPTASAQESASRSWIELELTAQLRAVLHQPLFQQLEANWRGLDLLVRNFGGEEEFKLYVVDLSLTELAADLMSQEQLEATGLANLLQRQIEQGPWAAWLGLYTFEPQNRDIELLGRLAKLSAWTKAPFLSAASPALVGCASLVAHPDPADWKKPPAEAEAAWSALRGLPEAAYLGLAMPRFLLRQPYGKNSDPIESFPFEEMSTELAHEEYLWGNPALVCATLLGEAFRAEGWQMQPAGYGELGDLPVHVFKADGETQTKACAEVWLSERAAGRVLAAGLVPLVSIKGRDTVRVAGLQSVRADSAALAGAWA
jgi:type VI secretion system protein ImpC